MKKAVGNKIVSKQDKFVEKEKVFEWRVREKILMKVQRRKKKMRFSSNLRFWKRHLSSRRKLWGRRVWWSRRYLRRRKFMSIVWSWVMKRKMRQKVLRKKKVLRRKKVLRSKYLWGVWYRSMLIKFNPIFISKLSSILFFEFWMFLSSFCLIYQCGRSYSWEKAIAYPSIACSTNK